MSRSYYSWNILKENMNNLIEFFKETDGKLSMTRLLCFLSFFPASFVLIKTPSNEALGLYLGAYVLGYLGGKHGWAGSVEHDRKDKEEDQG